MNSGTYNYFLNGEPTGVTETFETKMLPDGMKITTSVRDASPYKTIITVETLERDNRIQSCKINYKKGNSITEADYNFNENSLTFSQKTNGIAQGTETINLSERYIFFPLMRSFQGRIILEVAANNDVLTVIVPDILVNTLPENLLKPTFDKRTAKFLRSDTITLYRAESVSTKVNIYSYLSQHYGEKSEFYLDENGLLVYYRFVQSETQIWEIYLDSQS